VESGVKESENVNGGKAMEEEEEYAMTGLGGDAKS